MKRLFLAGVLAIVALAVAFGYLVWRVSDPGQPAPVAAAPAALAPPATASASLAPPSEAPVPAPAIEPERPVMGLASDRDPRNDVQRPDDRRADLLEEERSAKLESAMDQLNRRTALRKEEMQANGEVRPSVPVRKVRR